MSADLMTESGDAVALTSVPVVFTADGHMTQILEMGVLAEGNHISESKYEGEVLGTSAVTQSGDFPVLFQSSVGCTMDMLQTMADSKPATAFLQSESDNTVTSCSFPTVLSKVGLCFDSDVLEASETSKSMTQLQSSIKLNTVHKTESGLSVMLSGNKFTSSVSADGMPVDDPSKPDGAESDQIACDDGHCLDTTVSVSQDASMPAELKAESGATALPITLADTGEGLDMESAVEKPEEASPASIFPEGAVLVETPQGLMLSVGDELRAVTLTEGPDSQGNHLLSISNNCIPVALLSQCAPGGLMEEQEGGVVYHGGAEGEIGVDGAIVSSTQLPLVSQQTLTVSVGDTEEPKKKTRGWPKGKKRKPVPEVMAPRAPMTGYVLFAINRRQEIKRSHPHLPFTEVTKVLGQEWSTMPPDKKQKFLDEAENDKQRYIDELKQFQQSEMYQTLVKKRNRNGEDGGDDADEAEEENDELHCRVCKMYFSSLHNKKEHLLGKQHLQAITDQLKKEMKKQQKEQEADLRDPLVGMEIGDLGENEGLFESEPAVTGSSQQCSCWSKPVNVSGAISDFIHRVYERDQEVLRLRNLLRKHSQRNLAICKQMQEMKDYERKLRQELRNLTAHTAILNGRINTLKMVPALFGVGELLQH